MKKVLLVLLPILLIGGIVTGLAFVGIVKVPFLPFGKNKAVAKAPKDDGKKGPFVPFVAMAAKAAKDMEREAALVKAKAPKPEAAPPVDPEPGERKLAGLWAEMPTDRLAAMVEKWPEPQLGRILSNMDEEAVTSLLAALPAPRAASLSRAVAAATDERASKVHTNGEK